MRILLDQAVYDLRNKGNVAMLQAALGRLRQFWPDANYEVITSAPHLLRLYCPGTRPVSPDGQYDWTNELRITDDIFQRMPRSMLRWLLEAREEVWRRWPKSTDLALVTGHAQISGTENHNESDFPFAEHVSPDVSNWPQNTDPVCGIDLFVATGGHYLSDATRDDTMRVLDRLEFAAQQGIPTVMVGQGVGPINDPELRSRMATVLPQIDRILVRERLAAPQLLAEFGVQPERIFVTGDDAIEMAYMGHSHGARSDLGISLRIAHSTEVESHDIEMIQEALASVVKNHNFRLITLPISHSAHELDAEVIRRLVKGHSAVVDSRQRFDTPQDLIRKIGRCRVVVTGTYHVAVFALAQGVPTVCIARSNHYTNKFVGLADAFEPGCWVINLDDDEFSDRLTHSINWAWESAEQVCSNLLTQALRQIELNRTAYQQLADLLTSAMGMDPDLSEKE